MNKEKELAFLEALYEIQKASDLEDISLDEGADKEPGIKGGHKR